MTKDFLLLILLKYRSRFSETEERNKLKIHFDFVLASS